MEFEKIRVFIVDDHDMVRETWKMLLQSCDDIEVIKDCASGAEAIDIAHTLDPHVILMDINMSPVNGFEATRKILKRSPHIRIIGISVNNQPGYAKNIMQLGARGYVTKNSSKDEMVSAIREVMKGKTYICKEVLRKMNELK
jgi:DNA-binding NarL/FixJ family response regulator